MAFVPLCHRYPQLTVSAAVLSRPASSTNNKTLCRTSKVKDVLFCGWAFLIRMTVHESSSKIFGVMKAGFEGG